MELSFRPLEASEIDCRVQSIKEKGLILLLYKDARCDQNILDETVGAMNWQRHHTRDNANCIVSIWDDEKKQWIEKEDTGTESNTEKAKGLASDSFKRACFNWGIGRELYTSPFIWVRSEDCNIQNGRCNDTFSVVDIGYTDGVIAFLVIKNNKTKQICYTFDMRKNNATKKKQTEPQQDDFEDHVISATDARVIKRMLEETESDVQMFLKVFNVNSVEEMTAKQYVEASKMLAKKREQQNGKAGK